MEERELVALLRRAGDGVEPGPAPVRAIVAEGRALRERRGGRVRVLAVAAAAAAVVGGGSLAATVLDLPSSGGDEAATADAAGGAVADGDGEAGVEAVPEAAEDAATASVVPEVVVPGASVLLTPDDADVDGFGLLWYLDRREDGGWAPAYALVPAYEGNAPRWVPADEDPAADALLVPYEEPLRFVVPPEAAPGEYRLCQTVAEGPVCGYLTVTG